MNLTLEHDGVSLNLVRYLKGKIRTKLTEISRRVSGGTKVVDATNPWPDKFR